MNTSSQSLRQTLIGRNVLVLFGLFLLGASIDASSLPGQILALPSYLIMTGVDLFEIQSGVSLNGRFHIVLVAVFYFTSVVIAAGYSAIKSLAR